MAPRTISAVMVFALLAISCGTSSATSSYQIPKAERVLGLDDEVRVEVTVLRDPLRPNGAVKLICEVENRRSEPIVIYDVDSLAIYDPATRTFTVNVGAEIPHPNSQPVEILSAERRTFEQTVSLQASPALLQRMGNVLRVRLHFLMSAIGFGDFSPEEGPDVIRWAEYKRTVDTNTVPMY